MGALATHDQVGRVEAEMNKLMAEQELVFNPELNLVGATKAGAFYSPKLFVNTDPFNKTQATDSNCARAAGVKSLESKSNRTASHRTCSRW